MMREMSIRIFARKCMVRSDDGLRGQMCMHLASHKRGTQTPHDTAGNQTNVGILSRLGTSYFVASHFAMLDDNNIDLFVRREQLFDRRHTDF